MDQISLPLTYRSGLIIHKMAREKNYPYLVWQVAIVVEVKKGVEVECELVDLELREVAGRPTAGHVHVAHVECPLHTPVKPHRSSAPGPIAYYLQKESSKKDILLIWTVERPSQNFSPQRTVRPILMISKTTVPE